MLAEASSPKLGNVTLPRLCKASLLKLARDSSPRLAKTTPSIQSKTSSPRLGKASPPSLAKASPPRLVKASPPSLSLPALCWVLVTAPLLCQVIGMRRFDALELPATVTTQRLLLQGPSACPCMTQCRLNRTCMAVTASPSGQGGWECRFTSTFPDATSLMRSKIENTVTYRRVCDGSVFEFVAGAGCYHFSSNAVTIQVARISCPAGSALASPSSSAIFNNLAYHLNQKSKYENFWVDIAKVSGNWIWGDGIVETSSPGTGPWGTDKAGQRFPGQCCDTAARMKGTIGYFLDDSPDIYAFRFICHILN